MTKEDFLFLMGDEPETDAAFVDSFIMKRSQPIPGVLIKSGNPVSIITSNAQNAISTILSFSPKQSGTGDPSPTNVRPIEGWTEANLGVNSETPTTTISLGDTYYGFSIDLERGVLRVTHAIVDLGALAWNYNPASATTQRYFSALVSDCAIVDRYTAANALCDIYKIDTWRHLYDLTSDKSFAVSDGNTNHSIYIRDTDYDNAIDFTTAVNGHKIAYPLATPTELPLTPQTVALLEGNNTLWTDGDSLSVTYTGYDLRRM